MWFNLAASCFTHHVLIREYAAVPLTEVVFRATRDTSLETRSVIETLLLPYLHL